MEPKAVKYTVEYTRAFGSVQEVAALNVEILRQAQSFFNHSLNFSVHRTTGFIRQIPNAHGWIFTDSDDVKCSLVIASDTRKPIVICDETPVDSHVMDVICAMEVLLVALFDQP